MIIGLNNQKVRHHNKQVLLALLYQLKEASKSTLARHCELSIPAVSTILDELVADGAISHSEQNLSLRGINGGSYRIASGKGASAVYIYRRKNRPYTVRIITNDSTVMNRLPRIVTSHKGMLAKKPTFSMADCTSPGSATPWKSSSAMPRARRTRSCRPTLPTWKPDGCCSSMPRRWQANLCLRRRRLTAKDRTIRPA